MQNDSRRIFLKDIFLRNILFRYIFLRNIWSMLEYYAESHIERREDIFGEDMIVRYKLNIHTAYE